MSPLWRYYLPGYLLALPMTLIGVLVAMWYQAYGWQWRDGCVECWVPDLSDRVAMTAGWLVIYRQPQTDNDLSWIDIARVHERAHVVQGLVLGPLFWVLYFAWFLPAWVTRSVSFQTYYRNPFERHARRCEGRSGAWGSA